MAIVQVADFNKLMLSIVGPTGPAGGPTGPVGPTGPAGGGTGGTLSGTGINAAVPGATGFWKDVDGSSSIWRFTTRFFIGGAVAQSDNRVGAQPAPGFIPDAATGANWAIRDAQLGVMQTRGGLAVVGMSRSSDGAGPSSAPAAIGTSGFVIADRINKSGWAGYFDVQYQPTPDATNGYGYGIEIAVKNKGANYETTPDFATVGTYGIWLNCGDPSYGGAPTNPNNTAILIGSGVSGNTWNRGISFLNDGLTRDPTFNRARAISLGKLHHVSWYDNSNHEAFYITSGVTDPGKGASMLVLNNLVVFSNQGGNPIWRIVNADFVTANSLQFTNSVAGQPVDIGAFGTDANIDIKLTPKGTGKILGISVPVVTVGFTQADYIVDGVADDVQINAAITAVSAAGGGTVKLKSSATHYEITSAIRLKDNVTLEGEGAGTVLFLKNASNCNVITNDDHVLGNVNCQIVNLTVDGNGANQSNISGQGDFDAVYFLFSTNLFVSRNHFKNGNRHNCFFSDSCQQVRVHGNRMQDAVGLSNLSAFNGNDFSIVGNIQSGAAQTGMKFDTCHTVTITGNVCENNTTIGIYVTGTTSVAITGNSCRGAQNGVRITSADYIVVSGNSIRSTTNGGIELLQNCNHINITGNMIRDPGSASVGAYDGVNVQDVGTACGPLVISGNEIVDTLGNMRYGIGTFNLTDDVTYGTNVILGALTAPVSLTGTRNLNTDATKYIQAMSALLGGALGAL